MGGAVEVRKNERDVVIKDARAVAAAHLALGGEHIQELALEHHAEEPAGLGAERVVKALARLENVVRAALRAGVAGAEHQRVVGKAHRIFLAETLGLLAVDAVRDRDKIFDDAGTEAFHIFFRIAVALHAVVAELRVAAVAELLAHLIAQVHQLVIDAVELRLVFLVPGALRFPRGQTHGVIEIGLLRLQLADRVHAALKRDLRRGDQLVIRFHELVFLLQQRDDLGRERLRADLGVREDDLAELRLEIGTERALQQRLGPKLGILLQLGHGAVPELHLFIIELVARIDGISDAHQRHERIHIAAALVHLQKGSARGGVVLRRLQTLSERGHLFFQRRNVRPLIRHLRKLQVWILQLL